jgi:hypothetical protein
MCATGICSFNKEIYIGNQSLTCPVIGPGFSGELIIEKTNVGDFNVSIK